MADSTVTDISKMKVTELRKELKSRGLSYAGDKAELTVRLQAAMSQDDHGDITLDSDEIDSDSMLEDDDKSQTDILDEAAVETLNEDLALAEQPVTKTEPDSKPPRTLKRKTDNTLVTNDSKPEESKEHSAKKIVLNRTLSASSFKPSDITESKSTEINLSTGKEKVKITADIDPQAKMEMRAKRFGLPVKMSEDERKEARKKRFGQNTSTISPVANSNPTLLAENLEKLKKRAERFGQSVSKIMTDIETKEKLEKRKAKFNTEKKVCT